MNRSQLEQTLPPARQVKQKLPLSVQPDNCEPIVVMSNRWLEARDFGRRHSLRKVIHVRNELDLVQLKGFNLSKKTLFVLSTYYQIKEWAMVQDLLKARGYTIFDARLYE